MLIKHVTIPQEGFVASPVGLGNDTVYLFILFYLFWILVLLLLGRSPMVEDKLHVSKVHYVSGWWSLDQWLQDAGAAAEGCMPYGERVMVAGV